MDKIVVASGNKGKLREIAQILDGNEIVGYKEFLDIEAGYEESMLEMVIYSFVSIPDIESIKVVLLTF